jgi:signal transduction histidine kinase
MNFNLYQPPKWKFSLRDSVTAFRMLFLVPLLLLIGLSISFNRVNRHLTFYAAQVDNSQHVLSALSDLSMVLHEVNYNLVAHSAYLNKTNKENALRNATRLPGLLDTLDSLQVHPSQPTGLNERIRESIYQLYEISSAESGTDFSYFTRAGRLSVPNTVDMRNTYELIEDMKKEASGQMDRWLTSRNAYQSQLFNYNWLLMVASVLFMGIIFYLLDRKLLENKKYRVELENKIENLNRSNEELEQFAYSASHDLQEPLRKIKSFSDRIQQKHSVDLSGESKILLDKISNSVTRMQQLIHDLLAFSQLMRTQSAKEQVSLNKVLKEVRSNLALAITEKNAVISSDDLPTISAYPSQMIQLFQNLIGNSLKYSRPDLPPAIGISHALVKGEEVANCMPAHRGLLFHAITITDNGIGFAEEFAEKVFALFQRLHGRNDYEGTGIGLAICKRVVTNHNGYIAAKAIKDLGASFSIYLPIDELHSGRTKEKIPEKA